MLQHQQAQGAQRKAQNKHESEEIGGEKSVRSFDEADNANHQAGAAGRKSAPAEAQSAFGRDVEHGGQSVFSPGASWPAVSPFFFPAGSQTSSRPSGGDDPVS